jgi:uncharacterized cysteine cluster protein YcgN (CxxCxxCC family)
LPSETEINESEWEKICDQCGLCCFEKIEDDRGTIFFTRTPCRYLDVGTRLCKIYEHRFEINPECVKLTPEMVKTLHWLHEDCAYMRALGRKSPRAIRKTS